MTIEDSVFTRNQAIAGAGSGGDGLRADGAVPGGASGGAIANVGDPANPLDTSGAVATINNSKFVRNQAIGDGTDNTIGINGGGFGGALLNQIGSLVIKGLPLIRWTCVPCDLSLLALLIPV